MCGRWTKRSRRIFKRLMKEVSGGLGRRRAEKKKVVFSKE
jgi:hypothetical protein